MTILYRIESTEDIKKLSQEELEQLAAELRVFLVRSVSKTGGHLASNLGAVELTIAMHRVYDTRKDRIVFDVGHQSYIHKIITGRRDRFDTLRQFGGLSGFPKPYEAVDDAFVAGHASNAVSVAVGMAKARTALGGSYDVAAVLGDGAMTGGLAYEGLAAAAASREPIVIILNDNNMSIDRSVGGAASLLQEMRIKPGYIRFKRWYRDAMSAMPQVYQFNHRVKEKLKGKLLPSNMFSAMGLNYIGPVDGHNLAELESVLQLARDMREPVLVHVLTKKGKGVSYAEEHPEIYHGVGPFNPQTGELPPAKPSFSECFGEAMCELAEEEERLFGITAAMCLGTGMEEFASRFPKRYIDSGIAEGHATSMAAGMAKQGLIPVFAVYSTFLQRGYDMLIHDLALQRLHVVLGVDRAGLVGNDGETHHGVFDVAFLRSVPGMQILCPASFAELRGMMGEAIQEMEGPVAVRYPRGGEGAYKEYHPEPEAILCEGSTLTIVSYGTMINEVLNAAEILREENISAEVVKLSRVDGDSFPLTLASIQKTGKLLMTEEVCDAGCIADVMISTAVQNGISLRARKMNLGSGIVPHGTREELLQLCGLNAACIAQAARELNYGKAET